MNWRNQLIAIAKRAWVLLVLAGVIFYLVRNFDEVVNYLQLISPFRLIAAFGLIFIARFLLVQLSYLSISNTQISFSRMFYINSWSQLAKYLPGGIWHFLGRAGYYRAEGLTVKQTTQAMIIENIWLISSAGGIGLVLFLLETPDTYHIIAVFTLITLWIALQIGILYYHQRRINPKMLLLTTLLQIATWLLLGASLWMIFPETDALNTYILIMGAFCLGWAVGYLTVFAPSGLGVREGFIVAALANIYPISVVLTYVTVHRLIWILAEVVLALLAHFITPPAPASPIQSES